MILYLRRFIVVAGETGKDILYPQMLRKMDFKELRRLNDFLRKFRALSEI